MDDATLSLAFQRIFLHGGRDESGAGPALVHQLLFPGSFVPPGSQPAFPQPPPAMWTGFAPPAAPPAHFAPPAARAPPPRGAATAPMGAAAPPQQTRQRPQILFTEQGKPLVLTNGASFEGNNPDMTHLTHTFAFAFRQ